MASSSNHPSSSTLHASSALPSSSHADGGALSLDALNYAEARAADLEAVAALLTTAPPPNPRPARQLERLLRRRGGSSVVWRWKARKPVPSQTLLNKSRRDKRRAAVLRARTAASGGLETEAWHAKRFEMVRLFGLRIPWRSRDRAESSAVRAANETCVLHDASYWRCLELVGRHDKLLALLGRTTDAPAEIIGRRFVAGREMPCTLHRIDACPAAAIGPVRLLPCHRRDIDDEVVWLFVHHAAANHARAALREAIAAIGSASVFLANGPQLLRFQLRGPTSHETLTRALQVVETPSQGPMDGRWLNAFRDAAAPSSCSAASAWHALSTLDSPASLPPRIVLGATIRHPDEAPHPTPPPKRDVNGGPARSAAGAPAATRQLVSLVTAWPPALADSRLYEDDNAAAAGGKGNGVSVLLVQQPPASQGGFCSGWDLLLPAGSSAGRAVWRALILAGCRAIGQSELRAICLHADMPLFPFDAPDTLAGLIAEVGEAEARRAAHARRPPKRRPNHVKLRVDHPFGGDWPALLHVPRTAVPSSDGGSEAVTAMQFGLLRGEHAKAACGGQMTPLLRALMPRMLLRISLRFPGKGCARPPAAVHAARQGDVERWRAGLTAPSSADKKTKSNALWGGTTLPARKPTGTAVPAGPLLGFVTNGGFNRLQGKATALAYVAAAPFAELLAHPEQREAALLVLVRNPSSRQFRPALASVRYE